MNLVDLFLKPWVVDKKYLMPSLLHPAIIQQGKEHNFIDYVSNLPKRNFIKEDVDVLRLEDLFAKLKTLRTGKAVNVYFWKQGTVFAGFSDSEEAPFGNVVAVNATSLDEGMKMLFSKGGVRVISHDFGCQELYEPNVIRESASILDNPSAYLKRLAETYTKNDAKLCSYFIDYVLEMTKTDILVESVDMLDAETLLSKLRANKPKDAQLVHFWKHIEEDWHDLKNVKYETFLYAGYSDGDYIIGDVIAFKVQSLDDDVLALIDYFGEKDRSVLPVEVLTEPLSKFIESGHEGDGKNGDKTFVGKKINYERYVNLMPKEKIHFVDAEGYDVEKFFARLKSIQPDGAKLIHFLKKIGEDSSIIYVGFGDEGEIIGDLTAFKANTFFWDVNAMFERGSDPESPIIEKVDVLSSVRDYIVRLPWHNRPRNTYDIVKNK